MKLLTKAILAKLPALYMTDKVEAEDKIVVLKLFGGSNSTWLIVEGQQDFDGGKDDFRFYGFCAPMGMADGEWGYVQLSELTSIKFQPFGLPIERDMHFKPTRFGDIK
jgi:hypothetical protein